MGHAGHGRNAAYMQHALQDRHLTAAQRCRTQSLAGLAKHAHAVAPKQMARQPAGRCTKRTHRGKAQRTRGSHHHIVFNPHAAKALCGQQRECHRGWLCATSQHSAGIFQSRNHAAQLCPLLQAQAAHPMPAMQGWAQALAHMCAVELFSTRHRLWCGAIQNAWGGHTWQAYSRAHMPSTEQAHPEVPQARLAQEGAELWVLESRLQQGGREVAACRVLEGQGGAGATKLGHDRLTAGAFQRQQQVPSGCFRRGRWCLCLDKRVGDFVWFSSSPWIVVRVATHLAQP